MTVALNMQADPLSWGLAAPRAVLPNGRHESVTAREKGAALARVYRLLARACWRVIAGGKPSPPLKTKPRTVARAAGLDRVGRTELHYAAAVGDLGRVRLLLSAGADCSLPDDAGWTPLHFAAQAHAMSVAAALIEAGALVDAADARGNTPLFRAVFECRGRGELIALLRSHGADATRPNAHGVSPLRLARTIANFDVAAHFTDLPDESAKGAKLSGSGSC